MVAPARAARQQRRHDVATFARHRVERSHRIGVRPRISRAPRGRPCASIWRSTMPVVQVRTAPVPEAGTPSSSAYTFTPTFGRDAVGDLALDPVGGLGDPSLRDAASRSPRPRRPPPRSRRAPCPPRASISSVSCSTKNEPASGSTVRGDPGLERDDLLGAQRERDRLLRRDLERLVVAHDVDRLRPAEHRAQALQRGAHDVVERLLRRERRAGVAREEPQASRPSDPVAPKRSVAIRYHIRRAARSFATSSNRSSVVAKWNDSRGANASKAIPRAISASEYAIADAIVSAELLHRVASGLARVIPGDRDRVEPGEMLRSRTRSRRTTAASRARREDVRLAGEELLEDVVLQRAGEAFVRRPPAAPRPPGTSPG